MAIEDCLDRFTVPAKIKSKEFLGAGTYPVVSQEAEFINGYWNQVRDLCQLKRPVVVYGDHTQVVKFIDFDFVVGADGVKILAPKPFLNPRYLYYFLMGNRVPSLGYARHYRHLKKLPLRYPPLEEQQRIVAVLDEAFEGLTRAREHAEANVQNARELFESYLLSVFDQRGWQHQTLNQISENLDRLRVPITKSKRVPGEIPYYGASGVVDQVADYIFDEDLLLVSEDGANLLARTYPIAFSITGKSWVNNHAHVLRFETVSDQEFVSLYLNSISIEPYVSGMAQPKLNQKQLNRIPIPYPDRTTRKQIVIRAQEITQKTQQLRTIFEADLKAFDDLRQSLLQRAFTGELT